MKRNGSLRRGYLQQGALAVFFALAVVAILLAGGCASDGEQVVSETTGTVAASDDTEVGSTISTAIEAIPAEGSGEASALSALPDLLDDAEALLALSSAQGQQMPDIEGIDPVLTAYLVSVELDEQVTLCEVRSDGIAHSLYAYTRAFDSGSLVWTSAELMNLVTAEPQSNGETDAIEAVDGVMVEAFPDASYHIAIYGYRFAYATDDGTVLTLEVSPENTLISAIVTSG